MALFFALGVTTIKFNDISPGMKFRTANYFMSEESIVRFASEFDPQPIHLDHDAAENGPFGQLTASGWQTLSLAMKLMAEAKPLGDTPLVGVGVDEIWFLKPVFVGTTIYVDAEVLSKRKSSKPGRGFVKMQLHVRDAAHNEAVLSEVWTILVPT